MNKARKRFVLYAMLAVFVLLTVLLGIINGINFTMAAEEADRVTALLSEGQGMFMKMDGEQPRRGLVMRGGFPAQMGPQGADSPELMHTMRFFTFAFDSQGNGDMVAMEIAAVTEEEALTWAKTLLNEQETGWTGVTYRYRVYQMGDKTFVTVIDQGRELVSCYRILTISLVGLALGMAISCLFLMYIGKRLFKPLEDADRKQKRFIADVEKEFKTPLTVINANTEIMEREGGETEQTRSINRQVRRMTGLVKDLATLSVFDEGDLSATRVDLSALARAAADAAKEGFASSGIELRLDTAPEALITGDSDAFSDMMVELLDNAQKFAVSKASLAVQADNGRLKVVATNDTTLPDGGVDQVFDRFTRLDNAAGKPGAGLGLSRVKDIVQAHNGRVSARVAYGVFTLTISL